MDNKTSGFFIKDEAAISVTPAANKRFLIGGILLCIDALCLVIFRILFQVGVFDFDFLEKTAPWLHTNLGEIIYTIGLFILVMGLMPLLVYSKKEGRSIGQLAGDYGLKKPDIRYILIAIPLSIAFYFASMVSSYIFNIILNIFGCYPRAQAPTELGVGAFVFALLVSAVAPGIFEELFYRGTMNHALSGIKDGGKKIVFIALIFSLAHQYIFQTGYTFVGGIILGYLFYKTRSIYPVMIVHFFNNAIGITLDAIEVNGWNGGPLVNGLLDLMNYNSGMFILLCLAMCGVVVGLLAIIKKMSDRKNEDIIFKEPLADIQPAPYRHVPTPAEKAIWTTGIALMILNTVFTLLWAYV